MAGEQIPVKVYYLEGGAQKEIRKFTLDQDASTSYEYLLGRVKTFFGSLLRKDLDVFWKDEEEDFILVSSDDELVEIMKEHTKQKDHQKADGEHLKLYIRVKPENSSVPSCNPHPAPVRVAYGPWFVGGNRCGFKPKQNCGGSKKSAETSSKSSETSGKNDQPCTSHMNEVVQELATMFGFDADVATSQMQSIFRQMCPEKPNSEEKNEAAATTDETSEKKEDSASESDAATNAAASDEAAKTDSAAPKPSSSTPSPSNNFAEHLHPFFSQFGGIQNGQFENMGKMMETFMQSFGSHGATNGADRSNEEKKRETEGFVVVDEKEKKHDKSEEETFQQRLDEGLRQMEGMGFDNEGDWLKQLLVAKNLDISRVLDAMKSSQ